MAKTKSSQPKHESRRWEVIGILMLLLSLLIFLSLFTYDPTEEPSVSSQVVLKNFMGIFGVYVSHYLIKMTIGWGAFAFPVILAFGGFWLIVKKPLISFIKLGGYILGLGIWMGTVLELPRYFSDGSPWVDSSLMGLAICNFIHDFTGTTGLLLILPVVLLLLLSGLFNWSIPDALRAIWAWICASWHKMITSLKTWWLTLKENRAKKKQQKQEAAPVIIKSEALEKPVETESAPLVDVPQEEQEDFDFIEEAEEEFEDEVHIHMEKEIEWKPEPSGEDDELKNIRIEEMDEIQEGDLDALKERRARYLQYKLPSIELLHSPHEITSVLSEDILREKADRLKHALSTFNVHAKVVRISPGPVITLFEMEPAEGIRVNKFVNLSDDLARIMKAQRIRIIAPIPGSKTVGIELPNDNPSTVYLRNIINSEKFIGSSSKLSIAIGKTTTGDAFIMDIAKMPHLLIAGATGSGKSVCINTIIMSILYKAKPDEVKFIMIDPKKLELSSYRSLIGYHLTTSPDLDEYVMTSPENAVAVLNASLIEMERRYTLFAEATVRNINEYHEKQRQNSDMENIPYLLVLIDELADLMLTTGKGIEEPITRLAQMARAVGIHLIVATQRPSVDVITGLIKANFPTRIAFQVSQKVDSRTIIDQNGAEKLLGKGDMLYLPAGASSPLRLHNAFITLEEIERVMTHIASQPKPEEMVLPSAGTGSTATEFIVNGDRDELLWDAAKMVIQYEQASVSLLQRRFRIGYSRAGRLIDELESLGIISGYSGSKARDVLVDESYLENLMK